MTPLSEHLLAAAVEAGEVPADVAEWVDGGARPDPAEVDGHDVDTAYQRAKRWEIDSVSAATWAFRKLAEAQDEADQIDADYQREHRRLERWRDHAKRPLDNTIAFMEDRLGRWALAQRTLKPRQATWTTPAGFVRTSQPSEPYAVHVEDGATLLAWAVDNKRDDLLRPPPPPPAPSLRAITDVRKVLAVRITNDGAVVAHKETGELVPGLTVVPTHATVTAVRPVVTE